MSKSKVSIADTELYHFESTVVDDEEVIVTMVG